MIIHEKLKTKSIDEMADFLYALSETDMSKCKILCGGKFCYKPAPHRACRQKLKEYLERNADEQVLWSGPEPCPITPAQFEAVYNDDDEEQINKNAK